MFQLIKTLTVHLLWALMGLAGQISPGLRDWLALQKMDALMLTFMEDIKKASGRNKNLIDSIEVAILGAFAITETYLPQSKDFVSAKMTLDKYHRQLSESLLTASRESHEADVQKVGGDRFRTSFINSLSSKTRERYSEYRKLMLDNETGLWKPFAPILGGISQHLISSTLQLPQDESNELQFHLALVVVDHIEHCANTFR